MSRAWAGFVPPACVQAEWSRPTAVCSGAFVCEAIHSAGDSSSCCVSILGQHVQHTRYISIFCVIASVLDPETTNQSLPKPAGKRSCQGFPSMQCGHVKGLSAITVRSAVCHGKKGIETESTGFYSWCQATLPRPTRSDMLLRYPLTLCTCTSLCRTLRRPWCHLPSCLTRQAPQQMDQS